MNTKGDMSGYEANYGDSHEASPGDEHEGYA